VGRCGEELHVSDIARTDAGDLLPPAEGEPYLSRDATAAPQVTLTGVEAGIVHERRAPIGKPTARSGQPAFRAWKGFEFPQIPVDISL
jgi:hypothetical protein